MRRAAGGRVELGGSLSRSLPASGLLRRLETPRSPHLHQLCKPGLHSEPGGCPSRWWLPVPAPHPHDHFSVGTPGPGMVQGHPGKPELAPTLPPQDSGAPYQGSRNPMPAFTVTAHNSLAGKPGVRPEGPPGVASQWPDWLCHGVTLPPSQTCPFPGLTPLRWCRFSSVALNAAPKPEAPKRGLWGVQVPLSERWRQEAGRWVSSQGQTLSSASF